MMKFVFAFVFLQLCNSYKLDMTLNGEIIGRLETLNTIYKINKVNITLPDTMRVPKPVMKTHASSCVSVFVRELNHTLSGVMVHEADRHILQELAANLQDLDPHQQTDPDKCQTMILSKMPLKPFLSYIDFLRKLNKSKKR